MLCSKLHRQKFFKLKLFSYKILQEKSFSLKTFWQRILLRSMTFIRNSKAFGQSTALPESYLD